PQRRAIRVSPVAARRQLFLARLHYRPLSPRLLSGISQTREFRTAESGPRRSHRSTYHDGDRIPALKRRADLALRAARSHGLDELVPSNGIDRGMGSDSHT